MPSYENNNRDLYYWLIWFPQPQGFFLTLIGLPGDFPSLLMYHFLNQNSHSAITSSIDYSSFLLRIVASGMKDDTVLSHRVYLTYWVTRCKKIIIEYFSLFPYVIYFFNLNPLSDPIFCDMILSCLFWASNTTIIWYKNYNKIICRKWYRLKKACNHEWVQQMTHVHCFLVSLLVALITALRSVSLFLES